MPCRKLALSDPDPEPKSFVKSFRFSKGEYASKLEKLIKTKYECGVVSRDDLRDGYTETLPFEALPEIITITNKMISESILMPK